MKKLIIFAALSVVFTFYCGEEKKEEPKEEALVPIDPKDDIGIGPVKSMQLADIDGKLVKEGEKVFKLKCAACHKMTKRLVGPPLEDVTKRRRPEWIMNMILNPIEMIQKNATANALLKQYTAPMAQQNLTEQEARSVLEYFRKYDSGKK
ncbi:MAG: cytochrome c [Spirochaetia bacterium]|nr:cytochrome c [Spirochaetia bacterium]